MLSQCEVKDTVTAQNEISISSMSVVNGDINPAVLFPTAQFTVTSTQTKLFSAKKAKLSAMLFAKQSASAKVHPLKVNSKLSTNHTVVLKTQSVAKIKAVPQTGTAAFAFNADLFLPAAV